MKLSNHFFPGIPSLNGVGRLSVVIIFVTVSTNCSFLIGIPFYAIAFIHLHSNCSSSGVTVKVVGGPIFRCTGYLSHFNFINNCRMWDVVFTTCFSNFASRLYFIKCFIYIFFFIFEKYFLWRHS